MQILIFMFGFTACEAESESMSQPEDFYPSSCPDPYNFSIVEDVTVQNLRAAIGESSFDELDCFDICQQLVSFLDGALIKEEGFCTYSLDFETLPEDFSEMDSSTAVGSVQCDGQARLPCD